MCGSYNTTVLKRFHVKDPQICRFLTIIYLATPSNSLKDRWGVPGLHFESQCYSRISDQTNGFKREASGCEGDGPRPSLHGYMVRGFTSLESSAEERKA